LACRTIVALSVALGASGCGGRPLVYTAQQPTESPVVRAGQGDWDDVDAALNAALSRCGAAAEVRRNLGHMPGGESELMALTPIDIVEGGEVRRIEIDLLTLRAGVGTLLIERLGEHGVVEDVPIRVTVSIGTTPHPEIEACLAESIAMRLEQLRGVGAAPIDWGE
jgi:hypothetical protein